MKRTVAFVLSLVLALSLCACGGKDQDSAGKYDESGKVTISIGMPSHAKIISMEENALTKWLKDQTGYNIEIVEYSGNAGTFNEQLAAVENEKAAVCRRARVDLINIRCGQDVLTPLIGFFAERKKRFR